MSVSSVNVNSVGRPAESTNAGGARGYTRDELARTQLFSKADLSVIEPLLSNCSAFHLPRGKTLITNNQSNDALYLVLDGRLRVQLGLTQGDPISVIEAGDYVGELSLIDNKPTSARVLADTDTRLLAIDRDTFWAIIRGSHAVACNLLMNIGRRLRQGNVRVVENEEQQQVYLQQSMTDALTGLYNRRWLDNMLPRHIARSSRGGQPLALIMLDVDHFKHFNDEFGHAAGDHVLHAASQILLNQVRPTDLVARYGGEEFIVVLPETDVHGARLAAERIRRAISEAVVTMSDESILPSVTVSLGIVAADKDIAASALIAAADGALYRAKQNGRNRVAE